MSKDKELTQKDYEDAARRYHYASPAGEKERWERAVGAAATEFREFWDGETGHAARAMLRNSGRVVKFNGECRSVKGEVVADGETFGLVEDGASALIPMSAHEMIQGWCAANRGSAPKSFLHWFKAELKKIHDEAPKEPAEKGNLSELSDEEFRALEQH